MELTLPQLHALGQDPDIQALPATMVLGRRDKWWDQVNEITRLATEMDIWFVARHAALVFQTYPDCHRHCGSGVGSLGGCRGHLDSGPPAHQ